MTVIEARGLRKAFGTNIALDGVDLRVEQGRILGLIGPNGAGKTTALNTILGLIPYQGELKVLGCDPWNKRDHLMRDVCFIADVAVLPRWMRVSQALEYVAGVHPRFDRAKAEGFLAKTTIRRTSKIKELSKGMVVQLHLALVLAIDAKLLVLDEPTLGLDILYRKQFYDSLLNDYYDRNRTLVISTHQVEELQHIFTDLMFIDRGRIVLSCSMEEFESRYVEVAVKPDQAAAARALKPMQEHKIFGRTMLLFDLNLNPVKREQLTALGEVRTPSIADLFVAVLGNQSAAALRSLQMNTQPNAVPESSFQSQGTTPTVVSPTQTFYWSIRRELWENPSIYVAPLIAAVVFLFGFFISTLSLRHHMHGALPLDPAQAHDVFTSRYELAGALIMGTALIVGFFYSLDALYGERRDRTIFFSKSLPVSDLTTVLSKLAIPLVILPLLSFAITIATQFVMLLLSSVILAGSGVNIGALWRDASFLHVSVVLLYHLLTVHGLWYAPIYGWLLLVSAWAPRAPFLFAFLPPFVIYGVEKLAFNTSHFLAMIQTRLTGPSNAMAPNAAPPDFMATLIPHHFFNTPGLWTGLAVAAVFLFGAVRLRRNQGPI